MLFNIGEGSYNDGCPYRRLSAEGSFWQPINTANGKMVLQVAAISAILLNNAPFSLFTSFPVDLTLMYGALVLTVYSGYNYIKNNYQLLQLEAHTSHQ
ncbi:hypothetical protein ACFSQ7_31140 [Paenibacillus rhizoplanae]